MSSPSHDDVGRNTAGQRIDNEAASSGMGADEFIFRFYRVCTNVTFVCRDSDFLVNPGKLTQLFEINVHWLVADYRKCFIVFQWNVLVFVKNGTRHFVQFDNQAIRSFYRCYLNVVILDIVFP